MKKLYFSLLLILFQLAGYAEPPACLSGWKQIFSDEFDGNSLDKSKWNPTYNWGHTHNHRAYCVEENVSVANGVLLLKGEAKRHPEAPATCKNGNETYSLDYTSGAIDTRGKFEFRHGYIEGRFKMPKQLGTWPAFWMLQDGWPPEIDIFEVPHARNEHHYYLHYTKTDWYASHGSAWDHEASFGGVHKGPDKSADFHIYGLEWNDNYMNFYFDDKLVASYNRPSEISQTKAMYVIINLAIGGWATSNGNPIEVTADNPAYLECDWVRVWSKNEDTNLPDGNVRFYSIAEDKCIVANGNDVELGDCDSPSAYATVSESGSSYRINFGDKVLEIPNESKDAGAAVGLWGWNGKVHQQIGLARQTEFQDLVVKMKFTHSGHYVQTKDNDIFQDVTPENNEAALWKILGEHDEATHLTSFEENWGLNIWTSDGAAHLWRNSPFNVLHITAFDLKGNIIATSKMGFGCSATSIPLPDGIHVIQITDEQGNARTVKLKTIK